MQYIQSQAQSAGRRAVEARAQFIIRTYSHLFAAIAAFTLIEVALFQAEWAEPITQALLGTSWLFVMGGFIVVSMIATHFAHSATSKAGQYAALAGYVVAEALIFVPMLVIAKETAPGGISSAASVTLLGFAGLTGIA